MTWLKLKHYSFSSWLQIWELGDSRPVRVKMFESRAFYCYWNGTSSNNFIYIFFFKEAVIICMFIDM